MKLMGLFIQLQTHSFLLINDQVYFGWITNFVNEKYLLVHPRIFSYLSSCHGVFYFFFLFFYTVPKNYGTTAKFSRLLLGK